MHRRKIYFNQSVSFIKSCILKFPSVPSSRTPVETTGTRARIISAVPTVTTPLMTSVPLRMVVALWPSILKGNQPLPAASSFSATFRRIIHWNTWPSAMRRADLFLPSATPPQLIRRDLLSHPSAGVWMRRDTRLNLLCTSPEDRGSVVSDDQLESFYLLWPVCDDLFHSSYFLWPVCDGLLVSSYFLVTWSWWPLIDYHIVMNELWYPVVNY